MIYPVYSVRDQLNGFGQLLVDTNEATAIRNFQNGIAQNVGMKNNLKDYDLYQLGEYDTDNGVITPIQPIKMIVSAQSAFGGM